MNHSFYVKHTLLLGIGLTASIPVFAFNQVCARTPELAVRNARIANAGRASVQEDGYRVQAIRQDPVLNQRWALVTNCGHPDRPAFAVLISDPILHDTPKYWPRGDRSAEHPFPVVHTGDLVQTWKEEQNLRMEIAGRAVESGAVGSRIRVHILHSGFGTNQEETITGIVRGPGDVEIVR